MGRTETMQVLERDEARTETPCLHRSPPLTPSQFYRERKVVLLSLGVAFLLCALAASIASGWLLLHWDQPIQRLVEDNRGPVLDRIFRTASFLGSTPVVFATAAAFVLITWNRCRAVALTIVAATLARPLIEFTIKEIVNRDRPGLERLVDGTGPSFPSGHVMAAVALWGLLPIVVGLWSRSRRLWWASVIASASLILLIAASRVYLGVHWPTDALAGLLLGSFLLLGVEAVLWFTHERTGCDMDRTRPLPEAGTRRQE